MNSLNNNNNMSVSKNWINWTVWSPTLMRTYYENETFVRSTSQLLLNIPKEEFGSEVVESVKKSWCEFSALDNNFILVKVKPRKIGVPSCNDHLLYVHANESFCYSKISQKIDICVEQVIFNNTCICDDSSYNFINKISAYQELAQLLASSLFSSDLLVINANFHSIEGSTLILNQHNPSLSHDLVFHTENHLSKKPKLQKHGFDQEAYNDKQLYLIRIPLDPSWAKYSTDQFLIEKIVPNNQSSNMFTFTYVAHNNEDMMKSSPDASSKMPPVKKDYRKSKKFGIEEYLEREGSQRFTHKMEQPFQIPITRDVDPLEIYNIMMSNDLFHVQPKFNDSFKKIKHDHVYQESFEENMEESQRHQIISSSSHYNNNKHLILHTHVQSQCCDDNENNSIFNRLHVFLIMVPLIIACFAICQNIEFFEKILNDLIGIGNNILGGDNMKNKCILETETQSEIPTSTVDAENTDGVVPWYLNIFN